jgi:hypothetical protein
VASTSRNRSVVAMLQDDVVMLLAQMSSWAWRAAVGRWHDAWHCDVVGPVTFSWSSWGCGRPHEGSSLRLNWRW